MKKAIAFLIGTALGVGLHLYLFSEIEEETDEKVITWDEIKKEREKKEKEQVEEKSEEKDQIKALREKPDIMSYSKKLEKAGYTNYSDVKNVRVERKEGKEPYVIDPSEFGMEDEYESVSLTYYSDGILADDVDDLVDVENVGEDFASHFGDYEEDAVHIRNDELKIDYEILKDERSYKEAMKGKPQPPEVE